MSADLVLTELERDALTELANIGVSRAASSLRRMIDREVLLSVPLVEIVFPDQVLRLLGEREIERLVAVEQGFTGSFDGSALLILPESSGLELARTVAGENISPEDLAAFEDEALAETGNVILNACLGSIANTLGRPLELSLPRVLRGERGDLLIPVASLSPFVLLLHINFSVHGHDIRGYIALLMDMPSLLTLRDHIAVFVGAITRRG